MVAKGEKVLKGTMAKVGGKTRHVPKPSYRRYIFRVLQTVDQSASINRSAMNIMNNMTEDMYARITREAGRLARHNKKATITDREIMTAVALILKGELAKNCKKEMEKAVIKFAAFKS